MLFENGVKIMEFLLATFLIDVDAVGTHLLENDRRPELGVVRQRAILLPAVSKMNTVDVPETSGSRLAECFEPPHQFCEQGVGGEHILGGVGQRVGGDIADRDVQVLVN